VAVKGPFVFPVEILTHRLMHKFYVLHAPSPFIAGFDLVVAAHLIIDAVGRTVYTRNPATNSYVSASLDPISPPATNVAVISSSDPEDEPSSPSPLAPATLEPLTPASALAAHEPQDTLRHPVVAPLTPCSDESSPFPTSVPPGVPPSDPDAADSDVPEHLQVLFLTTIPEANLSPALASNFRDLLVAHKDVFARSPTDIGFCDLLQHDVDTADAAPIRQPPRRPPLASGTAEDDLIAEMLSAGVIEPFDSPWADPVCLAKKPDSSYRFCVDYRRVNAVSRKDAYPILDTHDAFDSLRGANYFATIDLLLSYWQIGMTLRAQERSAFCTCRGFYHFRRMHFGLSNAPATFCRLMHRVLRDHLWRICLCYLDDVIVCATSQQELLERLHTIFAFLHNVGLKVKPSKCSLFKERISFLGHMVSAQGINPQEEKIKSIQDWPVPKCVRDVRAFFGLASYYRKFVKKFASIAEPLSALIKKGVRFNWSPEAQQAFERLKHALAETVTLAYPQSNQTFILDTDASDVAIGAILSITVDGVERPIAFFWRVMNSSQRNYCPTRRELLAVIAGLQHFRHYLVGATVVLRTDHYSMKWLRTFKRPEGILARWIETLAEFDYTVEHRPRRLHSNADGLSRPFCKQRYDRPSHIP